MVFVPLTEDNRLCAKEIIGNRANLTKWQDDFHAYMVEKYPDLERGESASKTGHKGKRPVYQKSGVPEDLKEETAANGRGTAGEELRSLEIQLRDAIRLEEYEIAAQCRDKIRELKKTLENESKNAGQCRDKIQEQKKGLETEAAENAGQSIEGNGTNA